MSRLRKGLGFGVWFAVSASRVCVSVRCYFLVLPFWGIGVYWRHEGLGHGALACLRSALGVRVYGVWGNLFVGNH